MRVKICGITHEADALAAAELGADAIGLNFYARSPRFVSEERAKQIVSMLPPFVEPVALFAGVLFNHMLAAAERLASVRTIQFHGERLAVCPRSTLRFIPAFAIKESESLRGIERYLDKCRAEGQLP